MEWQIFDSGSLNDNGRKREKGKVGGRRGEVDEAGFVYRWGPSHHHRKIRSARCTLYLLSYCALPSDVDRCPFFRLRLD